MKLVLQDINGNTICPLEDERVLGYYNVEDEYIIHVIFKFNACSPSLFLIKYDLWILK